MTLYQSPYIAWFTEIVCLHFLVSCLVGFLACFPAFCSLCAARKEVWGQGRYELWYLMGLRYRGGRRVAYRYAIILAITDAQGIVCSWNLITVMQVTFFGIRKDPLKPGVTMAAERSIYDLSFCNPMQQTEGEKENLNSSNADSWHC